MRQLWRIKRDSKMSCGPTFLYMSKGSVSCMNKISYMVLCPFYRGLSIFRVTFVFIALLLSVKRYAALKWLHICVFISRWVTPNNSWVSGIRWCALRQQNYGLLTATKQSVGLSLYKIATYVSPVYGCLTFAKCIKHTYICVTISLFGIRVHRSKNYQTEHVSVGKSHMVFCILMSSTGNSAVDIGESKNPANGRQYPTNNAPN